MKGLWVECGITDSELWNSVGIGIRIMTELCLRDFRQAELYKIAYSGEVANKDGSSIGITIKHTF